MMNNKGQTLVLFVIFIPILLLLAAFIIDTGLIIRESTRLKASTKTVLKDIYYKEDKTIEKIKELLKKNNINIENAEIEIRDNEIVIANSYDIESIFGKIVGLKSYNVEVNLKAYEEDNGLKIEKE